jgi:hypothetical protein
MPNTPPVYSESDRHRLLMEIAGKVAQQVAQNPHPDDHQDTHESGHTGSPREPSPK